MFYNIDREREREYLDKMDTVYRAPLRSSGKSAGCVSGRLV